MTRTQRGLKAVLKAITRSSERSSLFWWMFDHHDQLIAAAEGRRMRWGPLCERFAALGLTDAIGKPASVRTARETWRQVRAAVGAARSRAAAKEAARLPDRLAGRTNPSRMPPNWRPEVVPPAPLATALPVAPGERSAPAGTAAAPVPPARPAKQPSTPEEVVEAALNDLREFDWHLRLPQ